MAGNRMTELEMYKETVKAVHNQYIEVLTELEDRIHDAYISRLIPTYNVDVEDALIITHATFNIACKALKDSCDAAIKVIESEMEK